MARRARLGRRWAGPRCGARPDGASRRRPVPRPRHRRRWAATPPSARGMIAGRGGPNARGRGNDGCPRLGSAPAPVPTTRVARWPRTAGRPATASGMDSATTERPRAWRRPPVASTPAPPIVDQASGSATNGQAARPGPGAGVAAREVAAWARARERRVGRRRPGRRSPRRSRGWPRRRREADSCGSGRLDAAATSRMASARRRLRPRRRGERGVGAGTTWAYGRKPSRDRLDGRRPR